MIKMQIQCNVCQKSVTRTIVVLSPLRILLSILIDRGMETVLLCSECYNSYNEATRRWLEIKRPDLFSNGNQTNIW